MSDTYTTVQGDTWDKIAYDLYGDEAYMRYLVEANWEFLDFLVFPSGIVLNLPEIPDEPDEDWPEWRLDDDEDEDIDGSVSEFDGDTTFEQYIAMKRLFLYSFVKSDKSDEEGGEAEVDDEDE